ncbi:hypothetical protein AYK26_04910 [Euryarchaeota archaeon SM23-78]|nr:MAG: hypothetical protein AYK26_04910 [Euryarchaeota archaeon SM23-78]
MWYLKYKFIHKDCIYAPKLREYNLSVFFFPLSHYKEGNFVFTNSIQQVVGEKKNIKKYVTYLEKHPKIVKIDVYDNIIFTLAKHKTDLKMYETVYNPALIFVAPGYQDKEGFEVWEVACWERKPLENMIFVLKNNKTTIHFEILKLVEKRLNDVFVMKLLPKLAPKQQEALRLAYKMGYYKFPRKVDLDKLAKIAKVSKPTFRENLRKAEAKLMPYLISE